jgi:hypothetical protein
VAKPDFSVAEAFSAGVDVIERSFKSVLIWAVAMFFLALIPAIVAFQLKGGHFVVPDGGFRLQGVTNVDSGLALKPGPPALGLDLLLGLTGIFWNTFAGALIYAAIYRTSWARKTGPWGRLRLGATEGWLFLVLLIQVLCLLVAVCVGWGGFFVLVLTAAIAGAPAAAWILAGGLILIWGLLLWLGLRMSLSQAMTVATGKFHFFESWGLTRGRSWKLFWTFWLVVALIIGLEVLYLAMLVLGYVLIVGGALSATTLQSVHLQAPNAFALPAGIVWLGVASFLGALLRTLLVAPLASAYRGLAGSD